MFSSDNAKEIGSKGGKQSKKRDVVTQHIIAELNEIDPTTKMSRARMLARVLVNSALGGDLRAAQEAMDRVEGKAKQELDVHHEGEFTLKSVVVSQLDSFFADTTPRLENRPDADVVPN